ncbi:hypothetical protein KY284_037584 [Solanum tuberosum]|nr:hypothetical protein KY284_037584 [Solanum tuberosum]
MRQQQSIISAFERQSDQVKHEYWLRLSASIDVVRLLLNQGFAFRGHDESKSSLNRGNFLEILSWYAKHCDKIYDYVLERAPQNDQMTSPMIQKDIVTEQMAIVLRYVDRMGFVVERLIDIVHVQDTSVLSLKGAIVNVLAQHSLSLSYVRGQCYDGASNMQGEMNGLKMLIRQESISAHSIHCFAHQLQLTLVAVSKKCIQVGELVLLVSNVLNVLGASFKRMDKFRDSQKKRIQEALDMGELTTGTGLHQELGLIRVGITDELNKSLQKKEQDIANAMLLVEVAKRRLQMLRDDGWDALINKLQELNDRFNEVTTDLLHGVACLNPVDSFSNFNIRKIMRMAKLYPDDFDEFSMNALENQLATYIIDVRDMDESCHCIR